MSDVRLPALDLLRGAAAFAVAIPHLLLAGFPGNPFLEAAAVLSVEVFFVLSGFVLAPQILMCFEKPHHIPTFLARRWMRTIPPYLLALVTMSLVAGQLGSNDFLRYAFYLQNVFFQSNKTEYFMIAWSLSVEEWFYVIFPICLLVARISITPSRRGVVDVALAFIVVVSIGRMIFGNFDDWGAQVRRVTAFRIDSIAYGVVLHLLAVRLSRRLSILLAVGSGLLAAVCLQQIAIFDLWAAKALFPFAAAAFGASAVLLALSVDEFVAARQWLAFLSTWAGRISFSTYLFHPVIGLLLIGRLTSVSFAGQIAITLAVTICFTIPFYVWFERPILRARPKYRRDQDLLPVGGMAGVSSSP